MSQIRKQVDGVKYRLKEGVSCGDCIAIHIPKLCRTFGSSCIHKEFPSGNKGAWVKVERRQNSSDNSQENV